ncbi:MAG: 50S ribosomal protein L4 [Candidatus Pacebacteria bacterium]|nr:50S ribosomal protein L4 [Candidatus Paceibacterota bacterium]
MKAPIYNLEGKLKGDIELSSEIFGKEFNNDLVYQVYKSLLSVGRKPLAYTKNRREVRGGGRKPWVQKGTGRARHGSIRSPLWKGGGVTFGPKTKDNNLKRKINKKTKQEAIQIVLSQKLREGELKIIEKTKLEKPKTSLIDNFCKNVFGQKKKIPSILFVVDSKEKELFRSAKNLPYLKVINSENINLIDLLNHKYVLFSEKALSALKK